MIISGTTQVLVNVRGTERFTRVCGHYFNVALRAAGVGVVVRDDTGAVLTPSKAATWHGVAAAIRDGKSVQASVEGKKKGGRKGAALRVGEAVAYFPGDAK